MHRMLFLMVIISQPLPAQSIEDQLRELRAEVQRLRQELDSVKQELRTHGEATENIPVIQAQVQELAQTKVETNSRFPIKAESARRLMGPKSTA